jgi:hypothetical protein
MVHRTIVRVSADGSQQVREVTLTRAQAAAELTARVQTTSGASTTTASPSAAGGLSLEDIAPGRDPTCATSDIWLYDASETTCPPSTFRNEICFAFSTAATQGATAASYWLPNYSRCVGDYLCRPLPGLGTTSCVCTSWGSWGDAVGSYWPGASSGIIEGFTPPPGTHNALRSFSAWQPCTSLQTQPSDAVRYAELLIINPPG